VSAFPRVPARARCGVWRARDTRASCDPDAVGFLIAVLTVALLAAVVYVVSAPLRRARRNAEAVVSDAAVGRQDPTPAGPAFGNREATAAGPAAHDELEAAREANELEAAREANELEAAREAKYREIRDAELDFRTGKLSREDYDAIDADLRAEAIEILNRLEALRPRDA
jgi:hypothetical protein